MRRFLSVLTYLILFAAPVWAQEALNPPLAGEMYKLQVFQKPVKVPEVMLSSRPTGLKYLSDYMGNVVLLNIWATWCPPCVEEMPSLNALQKKFSDKKFQVVVVSLEKDVDVVKKFMDENKIDALTPFIDANDDISKLEALKDAAGVPVSLVLNANLDAVALYQGDADWNSSDAQAVIGYFIDNLQARKKPLIPESMRGPGYYY